MRRLFLGLLVIGSMALASESTDGVREAARGWRDGAIKQDAALLERYLADDVTGFLGAHGLDVSDIGPWVSHPGGPKVIETITATLDGVDWILDYRDDQGIHEGTGNDFWFAYEARVKKERREGDWHETSAAQHRVLSVLRECAYSYTEVWT